LALLGVLPQPTPRASQITTRQEQPDYTPGFARGGSIAVAAVVTLAFVSNVSTVQEQPFHPLPSAQPALINVAAPLQGRLAFTSQEQPFHPGPLTHAPQPTVTPPLKGRLAFTFQEHPDFAPGWARLGLPPAAAAIVVPSVNRAAVSVRQDDLDYAFISLDLAIPGPDQAPPATNRSAYTSQEQPFHPGAWARFGVQPTTAAVTLAAVNRRVLTAQEYPDLAFAALLPSIPGPNQASLPLVDQYTYTTQEQPFHPGSWASIGVPPIVTAVTLPAVKRSAYTAQEQPDFLEPWARFGVPPNVAPPLAGRSVRTTQEIPDIGYGRTWISLPPISLSAVKRSAFTTQEQPDFVEPWARVGLPPVAIILPAVNRIVLTKQEYPDLAFAALLPSIPANNGITPPPPPPQVDPGLLRWNLERAGWPHKKRKPTLLEILADVIEADQPPKVAEKPSRRQKARDRAAAQQWAEEIVERAQREAQSYELDFAKATIATALREHAAHLPREANTAESEEQKRIAGAYIKQLDAAKVFPKAIVTEVTPLKGFYSAEDYHQDYALRNPNNPYILVCDRPKVQALKEQFPELFVDYKGQK